MVTVNESGKGEPARSRPSGAFWLEDRLTQRVDERNPERDRAGAKGQGRRQRGRGCVEAPAWPRLSGPVSRGWEGGGQTAGPGKTRSEPPLEHTAVGETLAACPSCPCCRFRRPGASRQARSPAGLGPAGLPCRSGAAVSGSPSFSPSGTRGGRGTAPHRPPARARRPGLAPGPHLSRAPFRRRRPPKMAPLSLCFRSHSLASFPAGPARWGARLGSQGRRKRDKKGQRGRPLGTSEGPSVARGGRAQGRKKVV